MIPDASVFVADPDMVNSISNITDDTTTLTTTLTAKAVPFSDVVSSYELDFGHATPRQQPRQLQGRGMWEETENAGQKAFNATKGDFNDSPSANFPLSAGQPNQRMNIFTDPQ